MESSVNQRAGGFKFAHFSAIEPAPAVQWLYPNLLPRGELVMLYGDSGTGKSFLALHLAFEIAAGALDPANRPRGAAYIACEGGNGMGARIEAIKQRKH